MNWINENKFVAGFLGFMLVCCLGLGFVLFEEISNYSTVHADYTNKLHKLDALQKLVPFPNPENLKKYQGQEDAIKQAVNTLEQNIAKAQYPLDSTIDPKTFTENLRTAIGDTNNRAKANNVVLPDKFALGFDTYLNSPPVPAAAPALDRELKAVQFIFDELVDGGGTDSISAVVRGELAEEKQGGKPSTALVVKNPIDVTFIAGQDKVRKVLNDLTESNKQFFIVRLISIRTAGDEDKPILKSDAYKNRIQPNVPPHFILGQEKLEVTLSLEIVNFNPPQK